MTYMYRVIIPQLILYLYCWSRYTGSTIKRLYATSTLCTYIDLDLSTCIGRYRIVSLYRYQIRYGSYKTLYIKALPACQRFHFRRPGLPASSFRKTWCTGQTSCNTVLLYYTAEDPPYTLYSYRRPLWSRAEACSQQYP
jgi:hypothetical protein